MQQPSNIIARFRNTNKLQGASPEKLNKALKSLEDEDMKVVSQSLPDDYIEEPLFSFQSSFKPKGQTYNPTKMNMEMQMPLDNSLKEQLEETLSIMLSENNSVNYDLMIKSLEKILTLLQNELSVGNYEDVRFLIQEFIVESRKTPMCAANSQIVKGYFDNFAEILATKRTLKTRDEDLINQNTTFKQKVISQAEIEAINKLIIEASNYFIVLKNKKLSATDLDKFITIVQTNKQLLVNNKDKFEEIF